MESTDKFKMYLNSIINDVDSKIHENLWKHLSDVIIESMAHDALLDGVTPTKSNFGTVFHCGKCSSTNIALFSDKGIKYFSYCPNCGSKVKWA